MSDRTVIALATVPMISGALLLFSLQRAPAAPVSASADRLDATRTAARSVQHPSWPGVVTARQDAELASEHDGRVVDVWVRPGTRVRKGQQLLQIDTSEAAQAEALAGAELGQRRSDLARAEAAYDEARAKAARLEAGGSWISAQELASARAAERMARAELKAARAGVGMGRARMAQQKLRSRKHTLEAPFDGVLVSCDVDAGDSVSTGQVLARVISDDRLVRFAVPRDQLPSGELKEVQLTLPGTSLRARLESLQPEVDPSAQMIFATAAPLDSEIALLPGTRVEVQPADERGSLEER